MSKSLPGRPCNTPIPATTPSVVFCTTVMVACLLYEKAVAAVCCPAESTGVTHELDPGPQRGPQPVSGRLSLLCSPEMALQAANGLWILSDALVVQPAIWSYSSEALHNKCVDSIGIKRAAIQCNHQSDNISRPG